MGNVLALTNSDGEVVEYYEYDDFGAPTIFDASGNVLTESAYGNTLLWAARPWDADARLYNFRHRWYDPALGRFLTRDPIGLFGDPLNNGNGYAFAGNSPYSYIDPYGLRGRGAECGQRIRSWSNRNFSENIVGSIGYGVVNVATSPLFLGEGTAEAVVGNTQEGVKLGFWGRSFRVVGDVADATAVVLPALKGAKAVSTLNSAAKTEKAVAGAAGAASKVEKAGVSATRSAENAIATTVKVEDEAAAALKAATADCPQPARGGTYILRDPESGRVMRSGRTNDLARREAEHLRNPALRTFRFERIHQTDVYEQQRGLEQLLHDFHNPPLNRIRPISPANPNRGRYLDAASDFLEDSQ